MINSQNSYHAPLISVVLPVFNGEKYLAEAVESILCQTLRNFELIVIDDGSTDSTFTIMQKYQDKDSRIRLFSRKNKGLVDTLNEGIEYARGEWIARMDADDIALPHRFAQQLQWLEKTGADVCGGAMRLIGTRLPRTWRYYETNDAIKLQLLFNSPIPHPTAIMRTRILKENLYDAAMLYVEDYDLWSRLIMKGFRMTNCPDVILYYRQHPEQTTVIRKNQKNENAARVSYSYARFFFNEELISDPAYQMISDRRMEINSDTFYQAVAFFERLLKIYGDPESVISKNAYEFFTRCSEIGLLSIMREANKFQISSVRKLIIPALIQRAKSSK